MYLNVRQDEDLSKASEINLIVKETITQTKMSALGGRNLSHKYIPDLFYLIINCSLNRQFGLIFLDLRMC